MQPEKARQKQFLFVDDHAAFLSTVTAWLKEISGGSWAIRTATNHTQALEHLKGGPVDTVVLDLQMPVIDGIEFLRLLNRTHPGQQTVILAGRVSEEARKTCLEHGAALVLLKPTTPEGFQALFAALDALATPAAQTGFQGMMQRVGLEDVLQMECLARKSSILSISTGKRGGQIYICDGEIVHAQSGQLQGEMALYGLLALSSGQFALQPYAEPPRRSISAQFHFLLMEAARLRDEGTGNVEPHPKRGAAADLGAASVESPGAAEARGVRIEEVLLCSGAREVLYQSKCESLDSQVDLLNRLEEQVLQAAKGTPSGRFHRLWLETGNQRLVIEMQPAFRLLVRSMLPPQAPRNE